MPITEEIQKRALAFAGAFHNRPAPGEYGASKKHALHDIVDKLEREIAVHFEYDYPPNELIETYRPNEPKKVFEYRIASYQQTTYPVLQKANGLVGGALSNRQVFFIEWPQNDRFEDKNKKDSLETYVKEEMPGGLDLDAYFWQYITPRGIMYPNSWVAVIPEVPDYILANEPDGGGAFRRPKPTFIPSEFVLDYGDEWAFVLSSEKSIIATKDSTREGNIFFYFLPNQTLQIVEVGNSMPGDPIYEVREYHAHEMGRPAIRQIGGVASGLTTEVLSTRKKTLYMSHLQGMVPHLNNALRQKSDIEAVKVAHLHPVRYEEPVSCPTCSGDTEINGKECKTCSGTGFIQPVNSPMEAITKVANDTGVLNAPVGFASPNTDTFEAAVKDNEAEIYSAYEAVNMEVLYSGIGSQQTARAKEIDREGLHNLLTQIGSNIYPLYQWILDEIAYFRYSYVLKDNINEYRAIVNEPSTYDTTNFHEEVIRLGEMEKAGVPASARSLVAKRVASKMFGANSQSAKLSRAYITCDPFSMRSTDDIMALTALDMVQTEEEKTAIYLHENVGWLVDLEVKKSAGFLDLDSVSMREAITASAKAAKEAAQVAPTTTDPSTQITQINTNQ